MRNQLKTYFRHFLLASLLLPASVSVAQNKLERIDALDEMSFSEMINSVDLDAKSADLIRKFQEKEAISDRKSVV